MTRRDYGHVDEIIRTVSTFNFGARAAGDAAVGGWFGMTVVGSSTLPVISTL